jgi:hypothetical protein
MHQLLHGKVFRAISGHRDAGATLCPGIFLYDKVPNIRQIAVRRQRGEAVPVPTPNPPAPPPPGGGG